MLFRSLYHDLDPNGREIRLLKLNLTPKLNKIRFKLETFELDQAPHFKALSYTWGTTRDQKTIWINRKKVLVSNNLHAFLQIFALHEDPSWIWIDQLCINQNRCKEKNHQVGMMGDIYRSAQATVVWLGPDRYRGLAFRFMRDSVDQLMRFLSQNLVEHIDRDERGDEEDADVLIQHHSMAKARVLAKMGEVLTQSQRKAIKRLAFLPYWERHWIAQEVMLSETDRRVLQFGKQRIDWKCFQEFRQMIFRAVMPVEYANVRHAPISHLLNLAMVCSSEHSNIYAWCAMTTFASASICQDLRDKVYGIQNLWIAELRLEVDYELPIREIYLRVVERWFRHLQIWHDTDSASFIQGAIRLAQGMRLTDVNFDVASAKVHEGFSKRVADVEKHLHNHDLRKKEDCCWEGLKDMLQLHVLSTAEDSTGAVRAAANNLPGKLRLDLGAQFRALFRLLKVLHGSRGDGG